MNRPMVYDGHPFFLCRVQGNIKQYNFYSGTFFEVNPIARDKMKEICKEVESNRRNQDSHASIWIWLKKIRAWSLYIHRNY